MQAIMGGIFSIVAAALIQLNSMGSEFRDDQKLIFGPSEIAVTYEGQSTASHLTTTQVSQSFESQQ
jgi:hypothetical protein